LTLAEAPVNRMAPCLSGSIRFAACCATRKHAERADGDRLRDIGGRQIDERAARRPLAL